MLQPATASTPPPPCEAEEAESVYRDRSRALLVAFIAFSDACSGQLNAQIFTEMCRGVG